MLYHFVDIVVYNIIMEKLFNNDWEFCEIPLTNDEMYKDGKAVLLNPASFFETAKNCDYDKEHN